MNMPFTAKDIFDQIQRDVGVCKELVALLENEQKALKKRDTEELDQVLIQKVPCLEKLEEGAKQRELWAQHAKVNMQQSGWQEFLSSLSKPGLSDAWAEFKRLSQRCKEQNEINGKLMTKNQTTINRLLEVLRGNTAAPTLYNSAGGSSASAQSHKFGEA